MNEDWLDEIVDFGLFESGLQPPGIPLWCADGKIHSFFRIRAFPSFAT